MKYVRRGLIPAVLLAVVLSGCAIREERGAELVPVPRPVVSSTIFPTPPPDSQSFFNQYEEWLRNGTSGAPNSPSGPLEAILKGDHH